jgi:uncharacterized protein
MSHHRRTACATLTVVLALVGAARAEQLDIVTLPQGSVAYGAGVAIAGVVSNKSPNQMLPVPVAGQSVTVPMVNEGRAAFTLVNVGDSDQAFRGVKPFYDRRFPNLRLAGVGYENYTAILVTIKSGIRGKEDLKGRYAAGGLDAHQTCKELATASLANLGMSWDDFKIIPVPSVVPSIQSLTGRAEVAPCAAPGMGVTKEVNLRTPVKFLAIDPSPEAVARARAVFPGVRAVKLPAGTTDGIIEDTWVLGYDFYLVTHAQLNDAAVYATVKAVWDNIPDLVAASPTFKTWQQTRMPNADVTLPYHPGAIRFYKEKGVWTSAMEAQTQKLLADAKSG